jgi:hypothetical protein
MNNKQVAHAWAHGCNRASGSHFYSEGATLYSYGPHFQIARLFVDPRNGARSVLFTERDYSPSTGRHKSLALSAVSHLPVYHVADVAQVPEVITRRLMNSLAKAEELRAEKHAEFLAEFARKQAAKAARLLAKSPEIVASWRAGERHSLPHALNLPVMLRRIGEEMETSKGARVPIDDARRAFAFAISRRAGWHRNGETCRVGNYQLDAINAAGIVAGCHRVSWEEAERFARSQGWEVAA